MFGKQNISPFFGQIFTAFDPNPEERGESDLYDYGNDPIEPEFNVDVRHGKILCQPMMDFKLFFTKTKDGGRSFCMQVFEKKRVTFCFPRFLKKN
jgi:hypothetical protein